MVAKRNTIWKCHSLKERVQRSLYIKLNFDICLQTEFDSRDACLKHKHIMLLYSGTYEASKQGNLLHSAPDRSLYLTDQIPKSLHGEMNTDIIT